MIPIIVKSISTLSAASLRFEVKTTTAVGPVCLTSILRSRIISNQLPPSRNKNELYIRIFGHLLLSLKRLSSRQVNHRPKHKILHCPKNRSYNDLVDNTYFQSYSFNITVWWGGSSKVFIATALAPNLLKPPNILVPLHSVICAGAYTVDQPIKEDICYQIPSPSLKSFPIND